ncbi:MAG: secretin N-terminal domain-containing protein [Bdellovibrionota bacterium]
MNNAYGASAPPWPTGQPPNGQIKNPYFYYFEGDTLRTALIKVAQSFEVKVHFSDDLVEDTLNQKLSGKFKVYSPVEVYNRFASNFGFTWFYYSGVLYITSNNFITKNLYVAPELLSNFKNVLNNDGLLDNRFGWSEIPSEGVIVVSGPEDYISLIAKKMKKLNVSPVDQQLAVFRLKYASAVDTTIDLGTSQIVLPGVATILKSMLQGNQNTSPGVDNKLLRQVIEPLKNNLKAVMPNATLPGNNDVAQLDDQTAMQPAANDQHQRSSVSSPVIQADNRLNTIIIRDKSNNIAIYKSLIALLDVPAPLIQVQVLILDIDQVKMNSAGINWWGNSGDGVSGGFGANNLNSPQSGTPTLSAAFGNVSPGNLIVNNLKSFLTGLHFLQTKGYAKAESKSAVVTIDNIAAVVNLVETYQTVNAQSPQGTPVSTQIQMQVTPHVIFDGPDKKRIHLTVSLKDGNAEEKMVNGMPVTLQGNLNSQAVIEEGSGLLLAGFSHKQTEEVESKVPLLGDIPILGWLFKDKTSTNRELQRSYLVTPNIIWSDRNEKVPNYSLLHGRRNTNGEDVKPSGKKGRANKDNDETD